MVSISIARPVATILARWLLVLGLLGPMAFLLAAALHLTPWLGLEGHIAGRFHLRREACGQFGENLGLTIDGVQRFATGFIVHYHAQCRAGSQPPETIYGFGRFVEKPLGWRLESFNNWPQDSPGKSPYVSYSHGSASFDGDTQDRRGYSYVTGWVLSSKPIMIEAHFADGRSVQAAQISDRFFAIHDRPVWYCELQVRDPDGNKLALYDLRPPGGIDLPDSPIRECPDG